jgi:hypothetical protein
LGFSLGIWKDVGRRAQGMDFVGVHSPGNVIVVRGLWRWDIHLYRSSVRRPWRGAPFLGSLKVMKGRLWGWESFFVGT